MLYGYELLDVWSLPAATAWIILGYFIAAMAVDMLFAGAVFCKHLCPIGQFNFVASTVSPTELRVVSRDTCRTCRTADCIKGRRDTADPSVIRQRGCELGLFLPAKVGNLDCTLCFDCVRACPHDNIALAVRAPGAELLETGRRSGIGTLARRPDVTLLAVVFVAAALVSAFAMTAPASAVEQRIASALGGTSEAPALAVLFAIGVLLLPAALVRAARAHYAVALVPFGFGVWVAHYAFHLLTGALTVVPVAQAAAIDALGWPALGEPAWTWVGLQPGSVLPIQVGIVIVGACGSIGLLQALAQRDPGARAAAHIGAVGGPGRDARGGRAVDLRAADGDARRGSIGMSPRRTALLIVAVLVTGDVVLRAHDGPPFPIVSDRRAGAYLVSVWTDPDATDDGSAGGQFWVQLQLAGADGPLPPATRATLGVRPVIRTAPMRVGAHRAGPGRRVEPVRRGGHGSRGTLRRRGGD